MRSQILSAARRASGSPASGRISDKFIAAEPRRRVDGAAAVAEGRAQALDGAAAGQVAVLIVDLFQAVQVEEQDGEAPAGAAGALDFAFEHFEKPAVICQAGKRIGSSPMADLIEELGVIQQRSAQNDHIAQHHPDVGQHVGRIEHALRLAHGDVAGDVEPGRDEKRADRAGRERAGAGGRSQSWRPRRSPQAGDPRAAARPRQRESAARVAA